MPCGERLIALNFWWQFFFDFFLSTIISLCSVNLKKAWFAFESNPSCIVFFYEYMLFCAVAKRPRLVFDSSDKGQRPVNT